MSGSHHEGHHEAPTNFFMRYVFSTDHKIIGLQFLFISLFFVILGGGLAIGVRYQLAWPNQNVPFKELLPNDMTQKAPEANIALWKSGETVTLNADVTATDAKSQETVTVPTGVRAKFMGFEEGLAITLPAGTIVRDGDGAGRTLRNPLDVRVNDAVVMASYQYKVQNALLAIGTKVFPEGSRTNPLTVHGSEILVADVTGNPKVRVKTDPVSVPIRRDQTNVVLRISAQTLPGATADAESVKIPRSRAVVSAMAVTYEKDSLTTDAYLQLFTMHATIMVFFVLMPTLLGTFGNFLIPLMIGARDMAFPKLNMLSFWISVPAGLVMIASFWVLHGPAGGGWTMYPPLSGLGFVRPELGTTLWLVSIGLVGFSTIVGTLNYITTIVNMRAPGMTMFRLPLTIWSLLVTAVLALFATPVLTAAAIMLIFDRTLGTHFFLPETGGQPLLWQHLFWFFGHPEVYILILPAMGIVSDVMAVHARKPIFGYKPMVFAMAAIGGLGFIVWGHHMFQSGMNPVLGTTFMASTIMIAVPSAIKTFNWLGTLWGGNIRFTTSMLFAIGFVAMFVIGGLSGIFMASAPVDIQIHDTYFIVGHIHYVFFGGTIMSVFAGLYHWYPKMFGTMMNERWGKVHFWLTMIGMNGTFFLMHVIGVAGHPRRYASILEYPSMEHLQPMNVIMTIFALALGVAQIPFFFNFFVSLPRAAGRAMTALFVVLLGLPMVMGRTFWQNYDPMANEGAGNMVGTLVWACVLGVVFVVVAIVAVRIIWTVGGVLGMPRWLNLAMYVMLLPLFLAPIILKPDVFIFGAFQELLPYRWLLFWLSALPGLAYVVIARPNDVYGEAAPDNPWQANSLEWMISSPPPFINFHEIPTVHRGPYEYSSPVVEQDYLPQPHVLPPGVVEPAAH